MDIHQIHSWEVSTEEAREIQISLQQQLENETSLDISLINVIAAADLSFNKFAEFLYAAVGLFRFPDLSLIKLFTARSRTTFPYVPGFLSFREIPPLLKIFRKIRQIPDLVICDGQGIAHPRGLGLASHLGLILHIPTLGCAKSLLVGEYQEPLNEKGGCSPLFYAGKKVGMVVRTRKSVKPVYVSSGYKICIDSAVQVVLQCCPRYRIPEPVRIVHQKVNEIRRKNMINETR